jgi:hypothetical protein
MNRSLEECGEKCLMEVIRETEGSSAEKIIARIMQAANEFADGPKVTT